MKTTALLAAYNSESASFRKLNPHLFNPAKTPAVTEGKRVRQSRDTLNKLETRWFNTLKTIYPHATIHAQSLRLRLGNGLWYKPDFFAQLDRLCAWEVKGPHAFRGGLENLKAAASLYPEIEFSLVWEENGQWKFQRIEP